jgi:hypothetical protein
LKRNCGLRKKRFIIINGSVRNSRTYSILRFLPLDRNFPEWFHGCVSSKNKEDKKTPVLIKEETDIILESPVVKPRWRDVIGQVLQFVTVGGDLV